MNTKIYVDNLAEPTSEADLLKLFSPFGHVTDIHIAVKRLGHKPLGYGFVTMATSAGARAAIQALNGKAIGTCTLTVSEAWPQEETAAPAGALVKHGIVIFRNPDKPAVK